MNERRANLIAELIKHLENLDGDELKSKMGPAKVEIDLEGKVPMEKNSPDMEKGPMEEMIAKHGASEAPKVAMGDDVSKDVNDEEMDDDEFEEMMKTHGG